MKKKVGVLGATGSIGKNTLDVLRAARDDFEPVLFTAHTDARTLRSLADEFPQARIALCDDDRSGILDAVSRSRVYTGKDAVCRAVEECGASIAVNGISGAAGLAASLAVLESGADLALANKESVVMAWNVISQKARERGLRIIPVDSEHSAIQSLVQAHCGGDKKLLWEIILTASGGPFRNHTPEALGSVTLQDALAHPTWNMGAKISIDSATLANKGLEVIEAARLFDMPSSRISVTIHPQSIVHSMIRTAGGAVYAELSMPDMRFPIHRALYGDEAVPCPFAALDFSGTLSLEFSKPDTARFPMLALAYTALDAGKLYPVAYNAANEEAVALFAASKLDFLRIAGITESVLSKDWCGAADSIAAILDTDRRARELSRRLAP